MLDLRIGTQETLLIDVTDELNNMSDLSTASPRYDVKDHGGNYKMQDEIPEVQAPNLMTARCLIDTTAGGLWQPGRYSLYLRFNASPDSPVLGPLEFKVNP